MSCQKRVLSYEREHCCHKGRGLPGQGRPGKGFEYCCMHNTWESQKPLDTEGFFGILSEKVPFGWMLVLCAGSSVGGVLITKLWVAFL